MHLRLLKIHSLPGIEPGFDFEPATDGVNIVTGPNAIGKSSLVRALKYLLAGVDAKNDPPDLHLEAEFLSGDAGWTVRRTGRQVVWMRDGNPAAPPELPGAGQFGLYRLSVESLLADDRSDGELADHLWRAVRGGFDLDRARTEEIGPRFASHEGRNLRNAGGALSKVRSEYAALHRQEAELPGLAGQIQEATQAGIQRERLGTALELHACISRRRECAAALEAFPPGIEKLHGDEMERLDRLDARAAGLEEELEEARRGLAASERELERTGLSDRRPGAERMARVKDLVRSIAEDALKRDAVLEALEGARSGVADALTEFHGEGQPPRLDEPGLRRAQAIIEPLGERQEQRRKLLQALDMAGDPPDDSEIGRLREGGDALRRWLAAQPVRKGGGVPAWVSNVVLTAWWATVTLGGTTALAAVWVEAWLIATASGLIVMMLVSVMILSRSVNSQISERSKAAKERYGETGLDLPPEWERNAVREHLRSGIEGPLIQLLLRRERAAGVPELRAELDRVEAEIGELETGRHDLAAEIGIDPALTGAPFIRFAAVTDKWDTARAKLAGRQAELKMIEARIVENSAHVREWLEPWRGRDDPPLEDSDTGAKFGASGVADALRIAFETLEVRLSRAREAEREMESKQDSIDSLRKRIDSDESERTSLYSRAGLEAGAGAELARRLDRLKDWGTAREALVLAQNDEQRLRDTLADDAAPADGSALIQAVESGSVETLQLELQAAAERADEYTELIQRQAAINERLDSARKSHRVEHAASELGRAEEALRDKRDTALLHAATDVLLDDVENAFRTEREPDLLRRARERFERVTAYHFTLELSDKTGFIARDRRQGQLRPPARLSSGTRMQLLLSLRLAWIEDREKGGEPLPLFLDEALTTSDEERFAVMAQTLSRLAETERRQVFYLCARHHEAALWERATGEAPAVIDLAAIRFGVSAPGNGFPAVEPPPGIPPPGDDDGESYAARLGVPLVNPRVDAGGVHLFHLLRDDLDLLHRLLDSWRIGTLGQLESLLASNAAQGALSGRQTRQRLVLRCQAARSWTELWRQGRGMPVDRVALDQCDAVTDVFLEGAADLAKEIGGDPAKFIAALRARRLKRFHASQTDKLEEWLAEKGYIDDAEILDPGERRRLTLQRVVPPTRTDAEDVHRVVDWMESAVDW